MDIAPELFDAIRKDFEKNVKNNKKVAAAEKKAEKGTADYLTAYDYATALADCLSRAFTANLSDEVLPNGRLYYNIGSRAIEPLLTLLEDMVAAYCDKVQVELNTAAGIGLLPV